MISGINKIIETIKTKIDKIIIGYSKTDESVTINYTDNSTKFNYSSNIPLPPDTILQLSNEQLGKFIKDHTILNIKAACKDEPKEMEKYLKIYNSSELSVGGNTLTTLNLVPWLSGKTVVEPIEPMPPVDFILQLPNAINKITATDSIGINEKVDIKIKDEEQNP